MPDIASSNPYEPSPTLDESAVMGLTRLQATLLVMLALTLILRGGFMALSWAMQMTSGFDLTLHFNAAIVTKDSIYGATGLVGGIFILFRHRIGWWSALVHWCWYLACEIVVVATAAILNWRIPVYHDPPALYRVMAFTALLAFTGLVILLWRPITLACRGPADRRALTVCVSLLSSIFVAFGVNWWMSLR
jgi:hypothetical protein